MNFFVLTLFPEMILSSISHSIIGRAMKENKISVNTINIRDFSNNKQKHIDDYPYGGGAGMVIQAQPVYDAYNSIDNNIKKKSRVLYMTPQGKTFNQKMAIEFSNEENIILLCGHYEGIDERVIEEIVTDEVSIGDFVITGGELASLIIIDSISRLIPGVLGKEESFLDESFSNGFLEYPHYTRPYDFLGKKVPKILLSGHHKNIKLWRREQSIIRTLKKRPDLINNIDLSEEEIKFIENLKNL